MKFRFHRGSLDASMATMVDVTSRQDLLAVIRRAFADFGPDFTDEQLRIKPYGGADPRIGWTDVHIVTIDGYGVVGFCDGAPP